MLAGAGPVRAPDLRPRRSVHKAVAPAIPCTAALHVPQTHLPRMLLMICVASRVRSAWQSPTTSAAAVCTLAAGHRTAARLAPAGTSSKDDIRLLPLPVAPPWAAATVMAVKMERARAALSRSRQAASTSLQASSVSSGLLLLPPLTMPPGTPLPMLVSPPKPSARMSSASLASAAAETRRSSAGPSSGEGDGGGAADPVASPLPSQLLLLAAAAAAAMAAVALSVEGALTAEAGVASSAPPCATPPASPADHSPPPPPQPPDPSAADWASAVFPRRRPDKGRLAATAVAQGLLWPATSQRSLRAAPLATPTPPTSIGASLELSEAATAKAQVSLPQPPRRDPTLPRLPRHLTQARTMTGL